MAEKDDTAPAEKPQKAPPRTTGRAASTEMADARPTSTEQADEVRRVSQDQPDRVAMVSRTSTGEAHQSPGYDLIGLPEAATAAQKAAAENRPQAG